jgi:hypothetical protein
MWWRFLTIFVETNTILVRDMLHHMPNMKYIHLMLAIAALSFDMLH